jgi:hypothetical protein
MQAMLVVGGGLVRLLGSATLPFTFQVTFADSMVKPGKGAKVKCRAGPEKVRQTVEVATGALKGPTMVGGHCSNLKFSSGSAKVFWSGIAMPAREQSL